MLKKSASGVLTSLRGSTYSKEYASPLRLLRPCWTAFLSILQGYASVILHAQLVDFEGAQHSFSAACWRVNSHQSLVGEKTADRPQPLTSDC